jgi:hypothetical protein
VQEELHGALGRSVALHVGPGQLRQLAEHDQHRHAQEERFHHGVGDEAGEPSEVQQTCRDLQRAGQDHQQCQRLRPLVT